MERTWPGNKFQFAIVRGKKLYLNVSVRGNITCIIASSQCGGWHVTYLLEDRQYEPGKYKLEIASTLQ